MHEAAREYVRKWNVIIPSCDDTKVFRCLDSLLDSQCETQPVDIIIVSDGLSADTKQTLNGSGWVEGKKPFIFAEAINAGARAADPDADIVILGDDVRFPGRETIDALSISSEGAAVVSPKINGVCGHEDMMPKSPATTAEWVSFICAYIPRHVWDAVGGLDERFVGYGYDDVDWCRRAAEHGEIRLIDATVDHRSESSFRSKSGWRDLHRANRALYEDKWASL